MKSVLTLLIGLSVLVACRKNSNGDGADNSKELAQEAGTTDSLQFPILIEGGTKLVYQLGRMTPDKGLKLYLDTVEYTKGMTLPDSLKLTSLFPLSLPGSERDSIPCVIAVSQRGYWQETILGTIDNTNTLRLNYKNEEIYLQPQGEIFFKKGQWANVFQNESLKVKISVILEETKIGDHLAGQGKLQLWQDADIMESIDIFLVYNKTGLLKGRPQ